MYAKLFVLFLVSGISLLAEPSVLNSCIPSHHQIVAGSTSVTVGLEGALSDGTYVARPTAKSNPKNPTRYFVIPLLVAENISDRYRAVNDQNVSILLDGQPLPLSGISEFQELPGLSLPVKKVYATFFTEKDLDSTDSFTLRVKFFQPSVVVDGKPRVYIYSDLSAFSRHHRGLNDLNDDCEVKVMAQNGVELRLIGSLEHAKSISKDLIWFHPLSEQILEVEVIGAPAGR